MIDLIQYYNEETTTLSIPYNFNEKLVNIPKGTTKIFFKD